MHNQSTCMRGGSGLANVQRQGAFKHTQTGTQNKKRQKLFRSLVHESVSDLPGAFQCGYAECLPSFGPGYSVVFLSSQIVKNSHFHQQPTSSSPGAQTIKS
jgi:hypothetical protein